VPETDLTEIPAPADVSATGLARLGMALADWSEKWFPDAFVFALVALIVVFVVGFSLGTPARDLVKYFGDGFWSLIPFTMQMTIIIVGGYVVATSQGLMVATGGVEGTESISAIWDPQSGSCVSVSPPANYFAVLLLPSTTFEHYLNPSPYRPPLTVQMLPDTALDDVIFFDSMDVEY